MISKQNVNRKDEKMVEIVDEEQQFVEDLIRENKITDQKIFENEALERFENRLPCGLSCFPWPYHRG